MPSWWRLLVALALIAFISVTLYPASVDARFSGIFDNAAASITDLDDDFDQMLCRLRPQGAANAAVTSFDAAAPHPLRVSSGFAGPGPVSWARRPAADRGPPMVASLTLSAARTLLLASPDSTTRGAHATVPMDHRLRRERNTTWLR